MWRTGSSHLEQQSGQDTEEGAKARLSQSEEPQDFDVPTELLAVRHRSSAEFWIDQMVCCLLGGRNNQSSTHRVFIRVLNRSSVGSCEGRSQKMERPVEVVLKMETGGRECIHASQAIVVDDSIWQSCRRILVRSTVLALGLHARCTNQVGTSKYMHDLVQHELPSTSFIGLRVSTSCALTDSRCQLHASVSGIDD